MEDDQCEIDWIVKDFEWILRVLVYDDDYDVMRIWIDLFVRMNVEMNSKNDVSDYCDENDELSDCVNVIGNENEIDLRGKRIDY